MAGPPVDRFDDIRRAWIAAHQGASTIQRRRAELLARTIRARQRLAASAVPDPHDDSAVPPLWLRTTKSPAAQLEFVALLCTVVAIPFGWLGGWILKQVITQMIPRKLRSYPIAALLWAGAVLSLVIAVLYHPGPMLGDILVMPWICLQVAAIPAVAGGYGIAEGWLAVPGSDQWWPLTPHQRPLSTDDAAAILGGYDTTGPGLVDARHLNTSGERTRP